MTTIPPAERLPARRAIVGEDTPIARHLPNARRRMVGAWCFLDHAGPVQFAPGAGLHVGPHPHIGLQTFTWMIEGEVHHRDSLGSDQVVRPGQVNLMTAGRGVSHTEDSVQDGARLHAAQLWIALPAAERERAPAFCNYPLLPQADAGGWHATVLAGSAFGQTAPTEVFTPLVGIDLHAPGAARAEIALDPAFEHGVLALEGTATVAGQALEPGELLYFAPGHGTLDMRCDAPARLLLLGGAPFGEDVLVWWNFVARTQEEVRQAVDDWNAGSARYGQVESPSGAAPLVAPGIEGLVLHAGRQRHPDAAQPDH